MNIGRVMDKLELFLILQPLWCPMVTVFTKYNRILVSALTKSDAYCNQGEKLIKLLNQIPRVEIYFQKRFR